MEKTNQQTKSCIFCAETIQSRAIKCRFCGEFLNTDKARAIKASSKPNSPSDNDQQKPDKILFQARPSLWTLTRTFIRGLVLLGITSLLIIYPIEELSILQPDEILVSTDHKEMIPESTETPAEDASEPELAEPPPEDKFWSGLTERQAVLLGEYRIITGVGLAIVVLLILLLKTVKLKMIHYEITEDRIEWSRGIFDRRVDNMDMFRVIDLKMRRSLLYCICGTGTIELVTTDKTDQKFTFKKIRNPRKLYDIIKEASLDADKKSGVVHLE